MVLSVGQDTPSPATATALQLTENQQAWHVRRLRLADGTPISVDDAWYSADLLPELDSVDFTVSIYETLASSSDTRSTARSRRGGRAGPAETSALLGISRARSVMTFDRIAYSGRPAHRARILVVPRRPVPAAHDARRPVILAVGNGPAEANRTRLTLRLSWHMTLSLISSPSRIARRHPGEVPSGITGYYQYVMSARHRAASGERHIALQIPNGGELPCPKRRLIVEGLGGADNIADIEACITRLRTEVQHSGRRRRQRPQEGRSSRGPRSGGVVQVVVGAGGGLAWPRTSRRCCELSPSTPPCPGARWRSARVPDSGLRSSDGGLGTGGGTCSCAGPSMSWHPSPASSSNCTRTRS